MCGSSDDRSLIFASKSKKRAPVDHTDGTIIVRSNAPAITCKKRKDGGKIIQPGGASDMEPGIRRLAKSAAASYFTPGERSWIGRYLNTSRCLTFLVVVILSQLLE